MGVLPPPPPPPQPPASPPHYAKDAQRHSDGGEGGERTGGGHVSHGRAVLVVIMAYPHVREFVPEGAWQRQLSLQHPVLEQRRAARPAYMDIISMRAYRHARTCRCCRLDRCAQPPHCDKSNESLRTHASMHAHKPPHAHTHVYADARRQGSAEASNDRPSCSPAIQRRKPALVVGLARPRLVGDAAGVRVQGVLGVNDETGLHHADIVAVRIEGHLCITPPLLMRRERANRDGEV